MHRHQSFQICHKQKFLMNQWKIVLQDSLNSNCGELVKVIKRCQLCPQSQAGCEQSNSKYARYKTKYSNRMGVPMIRARSRTGENGPPMTLFNAAASAQYWIDNGHRFAQKSASDAPSKTTRRIKNAQKEKYTSQILRF